MSEKNAEKKLRRPAPGEPSPREYETGVSFKRRSFFYLLGAGVLISVRAPGAPYPRFRRRRRAPIPVSARVHIGTNGTVTVMTGKVEEGQGARAELTQAGAEELRLPAGKIRLVMADTALVPDDGITAGSRTTPSTVPSVRRGAATARELLRGLAAREWNVERSSLKVEGGAILHPSSGKHLSYADLARKENLTELFKENVRPDVEITPVRQWKVLGQSVPRPNQRGLVTGGHRFPSDIIRPNMLYGKILRPPSYGATLEAIDLAAVRSMKDVVVVREGSFVGCAAPTTYRAREALRRLAETARWKEVPQVSSREIFTYLRKHADPRALRGGRIRGSPEKALASAAKKLKAVYEAAYIQHCPLEPRAAVAEWNGEKLTVWTGIDWPQRAQRSLAEAFGIPRGSVRVIVPDMGGGFGGKHTAEAAEEAARLARAATRPVAVHWTREEEFTWAYFRPAAVIEVQAGLSAGSTIAAWEFTTLNAGGAAIDTPYRVPHTRIASVRSRSPLRQGPYRCLAATVNNFARESFMDELAAATGEDPLQWRLKHLENERLRRVLIEAAKRFGWKKRRALVTPERGVGLACGTEKNSVVAACVEVHIDRSRGRLRVKEVLEVFECGPVLNPANLTSQVQGCIMMGLGGALREKIEFENGKILTTTFSRYKVPRFEDLPVIGVHLLENNDIDPAGGGETPIIAVAPAVANAVFAATGVRLRSMPLRADLLREA